MCCAQETKHASEGMHPGFETQGRKWKPKTGVSVVPSIEKTNVLQKMKKSNSCPLTPSVCIIITMTVSADQSLDIRKIYQVGEVGWCR